MRPSANSARLGPTVRRRSQTPSLRGDAAVGGRALAALALLEQKKGTAGSVETAAGYYRELAHRFAARVRARG